MSCAVSVIIPVYNVEKYLAQSLECIVSQFMSDIEIICVDDGSTDRSPEILRDFSNRDDRVRIITQPNKNAGAARNAGLDAASGRYLSFLDADDLFEPDMLQTAYHAAEESNSDFVMFNADCFDTDTGIKMASNWIVKGWELPDQDTFCVRDIPEKIFNFSYSVVWNKLFRHDFVRKCGLRFQEIHSSNDAYFSCAAFVQANRIKFVDRVLLHYRQNIRSSLSGKSVKKDGGFPMLAAFQAIYEKLTALGIYADVESSFFQYTLSNLFSLLKDSSGELYFELYQEIKKAWLPLFVNFNAENVRFENELDSLQYERILREEADGHLFTIIGLMNSQLQKDKLTAACKKWFFSDPRIMEGDRILLYGAGEVGKDFYNQISQSKAFTLAAWIDKRFDALQQQGFPVISPEEISELSFDKVIIAAFEKRAADQIRGILLNYGVSDEKIIWPFDPKPG